MSPEDAAFLLKRHLNRTGTTTAAAAQALGVGQDTIATWVSGRSLPSTRSASKIETWASRGFPVRALTTLPPPELPPEVPPPAISLCRSLKTIVLAKQLIPPSVAARAEAAGLLVGGKMTLDGWLAIMTPDQRQAILSSHDFFAQSLTTASYALDHLTRTQAKSLHAFGFIARNPNGHGWIRTYFGANLRRMYEAKAPGTTVLLSA